MRPIDADDFGNRMYHEAFEKDSDLQKWDSGCWIRYKLFENVLREQPTIQPVATDTNVGDTISRQQAIDALMERFKRIPTTAIIAKDIIENLPSAQPYTAEEIQKMQELESVQLEKAYELGRESAQPEQQWIPCSERLPEEGQNCLVCDKGSIGIDTYIGHGNPYNWKWYVRGYEAWLPLPEPYMKGDTT